MPFLIDGPDDAFATILLAHGAGAPMDSDAMNAVIGALTAVRFRVARFESIARRLPSWVVMAPSSSAASRWADAWRP